MITKQSNWTREQNLLYEIAKALERISKSLGSNTQI
jgi:hypothetical protein